MDKEITLILIRTLIVDGIPALVSLIQKWQVADPTLSDFQVLKGLMKKPEDFGTDEP